MPLGGVSVEVVRVIPDQMPHRENGPSGPTTMCVQDTSGTIRVLVGPDDESKASMADDIVHEEIDRLERTLAASGGASLLDRWIDDPSVETSIEFDRLLTIAIGWQHLSRGAFNVRLGRLLDVWNRAAADDCRPSPGELHALAVEISDPPYDVVGSSLRRLGDCRGLDLSPIVDGFIVDVAAETAIRRCGLGTLTVSANGKIAHRGSAAIDVCIGDLVDRSGVSMVVTVHDGAVSVLAADRAPALVIDPLTGRSVTTAPSIVVVAPDATTADAVGSVIRVMTLERALAFVGSLDSSSRTRHPTERALWTSSGAIRCWILDADGGVHDSDGD